MEQKSALLEDVGNLEWQAYLSIFKRLVDKDPSVEDAAEQLNQLKERAKNSANLSVRQREGIVDRCNNYAKGEYGNSKKQEHYEYGKPSTK